MYDDTNESESCARAVLSGQMACGSWSIANHSQDQARMTMTMFRCEFCTVALELKSLLPWVYRFQELIGLAIPLEPHAHARLVRTQVVVGGCQSYENSNWFSCHAGRSIGSGTFLRVVYLPPPPNPS